MFNAVDLCITSTLLRHLIKEFDFTEANGSLQLIISVGSCREGKASVYPLQQGEVREGRGTSIGPHSSRR